MEPFDFELMIGGLCMLHFDNPSNPKEVRVLLVNATRDIEMFRGVPSTEYPHLHFPRVTVSARNLMHDPNERLPDRSVTDSNGEDFGIFEVDLEELTLTVNGGSSLKVPVGRAAAKKQRPTDSGAKLEWLDWTCGMKGSSFTDQRIESLQPDCFEPPTKNGSVITSLASRIGTLSTYEVGKLGGSEHLFRFEPWKSGTSPQAMSHCLADRLRLRIEGIDRRDRVVIQSSSGNIVLGAEPGSLGRSQVRAALTNLHETYYPPRPAVYDFAWFYTMVKWQGGVSPDVYSLIIPSVAEGSYTPSSGLCPPAFWG